MRSELFIDFPVLSLGEEMQVDLTHNRAVLIRITRQLLRAIPRREAKMIIEVAHRAGHTRAKKTVAMNSISGDRLSRWSIQNDVDLFCVRPKHADLQVIELMSESSKRWEDDAQCAVNEASKTLRNIRWIYVKEFTAAVDNGKVTSYRINSKVTFDLETERGKPRR